MNRADLTVRYQKIISDLFRFHFSLDLIKFIDIQIHYKLWKSPCFAFRGLELLVLRYPAGAGIASVADFLTWFFILTRLTQIALQVAQARCLNNPRYFVLLFRE